MRRLFFTFFLLCFLFISANHTFAQSRIYGGEVVKERVPYSVDVGSLVGACGGSLIKPNLVLTAYHCLDGVRFGITHTSESIIKSIRVRVGNHDTRLAEGVVLTATNFYTTGKWNHDIAIIELSRPVTKTVVNNETLIDFIGLNVSATPSVGDTLYIYGRGSTGGDRPAFTKVATMTVWHLDEYIFCAKDDNNFLGAGDSGNIASLQLLPHDEPIQHGINSTGVTGTSCFTDVYYFKDWIAEVIREHPQKSFDDNTCVVSGHLSRSKLRFQVAGYVGEFVVDGSGPFSLTLPYDRNITVQSFSDNMMSSIIYLQDCTDAPVFVEHNLFIPIIMKVG